VVADLAFRAFTLEGRAMLPDYPRNAGRWEAGTQLALLMIVLVIAGFYALLAGHAADPDVVAQLQLVVRSLWITLVSFLLSVCATFLRKALTDPPFALVWGAILAVAVVASVCGVLLFLSSL
jgi:hypothetical protein